MQKWRKTLQKHAKTMRRYLTSCKNSASRLGYIILYTPDGKCPFLRRALCENGFLRAFLQTRKNSAKIFALDQFPSFLEF